MVTVMIRAMKSGHNVCHLARRRHLLSPRTHVSLTTVPVRDEDYVGTIPRSADSHRLAHQISRRFNSAAIENSDISPFQDIFHRMKANGPTALGTTQDIVEMENAYEMSQKKLECGIPENVLRFSSTAYGRTLLAPYVHPNEHRVIMKLNTKHLPFHSTNEYEILREIVGDRLNDERNELRLTSNKFGSRIENKRHLVSMLDRIISSCQKLAAEINQESESA